MTKTFCHQILKSKSENVGWALHLCRLWAPDFVHNRMLKTVHNFLFYVPKKGGDKTAHQSNMACTISTTSTIYNYLLLSTLPIPVRPGERSAKRRSGSSSTSSSGWSRWQLCCTATIGSKQLCHSATRYFHEMSFAFLENLGVTYLILFPAVVRSEGHQCIL